MKTLYTVDAKTKTAEAILDSCIGTNGVWADPSRYRYQCWTRGMSLAIMPVLLEMGQTEIVRTHLENLSQRQRPNGQIPILFLDRTLPFLKDKIARSLRDRKLSFMLKRWLGGQLWNLTPGTRDSEILYMIAMYEYAKQTGDRSLIEEYGHVISSALNYVEGNLMRKGLVIGCDWRDTMERELGDKSLLTNNSLLHYLYVLMGQAGKASDLHMRINLLLWNGHSYLDYQGSNRFDPLGGSLAILGGVAPQERYPSLLASYKTVDTPYGVTIKCKHNPISVEEKEVIHRTDGIVVWPFVVGFSILALLRIGAREMALEQFNKLRSLKGFREWYDPNTGKGFGAAQQLWSATLFLRAALALKT